MKLNILFLTLDDIMVLEFIGYSLEESLKDTSIGILEARYEKDAMELLESTRVDLIIADMNINTLESYEFYDKLQENDKLKNIPFVFLSENEEDHDIAILKGISNFFLKPLDIDKLLKTLHDILKNTSLINIENEVSPEEYMINNDIQYVENPNLQAILNSTKEIEKLILDYTQSNNTKIKEHAINIQNKINTI